MKIDFAREVVRGFEKQYPEESKKFNNLIHCDKGQFIKPNRFEDYDLMIERMEFLINLITELGF